MMKYIRLQGKEWNKKKDNLIMVSYDIYSNGHMKGYYRHMADTETKYTHWLSDEEIELYNIRKEMLSQIKNFARNDILFNWRFNDGTDV